MENSLGWGIVGTGGIASDFATALVQSPTCQIVNVVGSSAEKSAAFARQFELPSHAESLDALLNDPKVQAVYVATPHTMHEAQAIQSLRAGKHVLCEKPMTPDPDATERIISAARESKKHLMEAFMYRCHPLIAKLVELLKQGTIGTPYYVRANFGFRAGRVASHRLFNPELAGGGILDVGGYPASFARLVAGIAVGKPFVEPERVDAIGQIGPTGVDEWSVAELGFESGLVAHAGCGVRCAFGTETAIYGELGKVVMNDPWIPGGNRQGLSSGLWLHADGAEPCYVECPTPRPIYALQAELMASTLPDLEPRWPAMDWQDSLGNQRTLQRWRAALNK